MKTKAKSKSPPSLHIPSPLFVLVPFFGHHLRAVLDGVETWYMSTDVMRVLGMKESTAWNEWLFQNQRRSALVPDGDGGTTKHQLVSEAGFYKLLCLSQNDFGLTFNMEGGSLIYDMPGPNEDFDADQREFFRKILRGLHASWRQHEVADHNIDEWEMPRRKN